LFFLLALIQPTVTNCFRFVPQIITYEKYFLESGELERDAIGRLLSVQHEKMTTYAARRSISPHKYGVGAHVDFPISLAKLNIIVNLKEPHPPSIQCRAPAACRANS
jgi:hypothetical protein